MDEYYLLDPSSPKTFLKGVFITSALGSLSGAIHATRTRNSTFAFASQAGINSGIVGLTFFGIREYVVSPMFTATLSGPFHVQRKEAIRALKSNGPYEERTPSVSLLRSNNILDTALSGAITGAFLNVSRRGLPGLLPGLTTMGLGCTFVQAAWNELQVTRIKIVSRAQGVQTLSTPTPPEKERTFSEKVLDGVGWIFAVRRLSDEDYLRKLKVQRERTLQRIKQLEDELESEKNNSNPNNG